MDAVPAPWLGDAWQAALGEQLSGAQLSGAQLSGAQVEAPGLTGSLVVAVVSGTGRTRRTATAGRPPAAGDMRITIEIDSGRVVRWRSDQVPGDALATFTLVPGDAQALLEGREEPSVLYMQGRLKVDGDMATVLTVLAWTTTERYGRARAALDGSTGG